MTAIVGHAKSEAAILPAVLEPVAMTTPQARPARELPLLQLLQLSIYWFGINAIWGGLHQVILPRRMEDLVGSVRAGTGLGAIFIAGGVIAILVQPTVGSLSDFTVSRWGRRKPYIAIGAVLDVIFLIGIAYSNHYLAILAFVALLQFSSNFAQGPFQGYVPDLVPAKQVGLASGLMGLMITAGRIGGVVIAARGLETGDFVLPTIILGLIELATAVGTLLWVDEGRDALPRGGRSWLRVAFATWSHDILEEKSYLWLLGSRLFVLMGSGSVLGLMFFYLSRSLNLPDAEAAFWVRIAATILVTAQLVTAYPAGRLSDRFGRKAMIYASCAIGALGLVGVVLAPSPVAAMIFGVPMGVAAGMFLAVDWALMTDIIPKARSGRYMGISNVVTGASVPLAVALGGVTMDEVGAFDFALGPRAAFALGVLYYALGALLLRPVDERRRES